MDLSQRTWWAGPDSRWTYQQHKTFRATRKQVGTYRDRKPFPKYAKALKAWRYIHGPFPADLVGRTRFPMDLPATQNI